MKERFKIKVPNDECDFYHSGDCHHIKHEDTKFPPNFDWMPGRCCKEKCPRLKS